MSNESYILIVCTGNTCRSPMAEALIRHELAGKGIPLDVRSAGTNAQPGDPATPETLTVLEDKASLIAGHTAQRLNTHLISNASKIYCMERAHLTHINQNYEIPAERIRPLADHDIPDPKGLGIDAYRQTRGQIAAALPRLINELCQDTPVT